MAVDEMRAKVAKASEIYRAAAVGCTHRCGCQWASSLLDDAIVQARESGTTQQALAAIVGVSLPRVQQRETRGRARVEGTRRAERSGINISGGVPLIQMEEGAIRIERERLIIDLDRMKQVGGDLSTHTYEVDIRPPLTISGTVIKGECLRHNTDA